MGNFIEVKGVTFQKCNEWNLYLKKGDLVTPIWKRKKCIQLLITRAETGQAIFVNAYSSDLYMPISVNIVRLPQGVTYILNEDCYLNVLTTIISFHEIIDYHKNKKQ